MSGKHLSRDPKFILCHRSLRRERRGHGVIVVDNLSTKILVQKRTFISEHVCQQAGLAIENAILYRNLEEVHQELEETQNLSSSGKDGGLGEIFDSIAHEIKILSSPFVGLPVVFRTIPMSPGKPIYPNHHDRSRRLEKILTQILQLPHDESML